MDNERTDFTTGEGSGTEPSAGSIPLAVVGGVVAAIITGIIWALIVVVTDYELGFAAWGVGLVCGFATVLLGRGSGTPFQVIAVITSIAGILIGKYGMYYYLLKQFIIEEYGEEAVVNLSLFSSDVVSDFAGAIGSMVGGYDILWVVLAVVTAWKTAALRGEAEEEVAEEEQ